jgi:hypothetical protein
MWGVYCLTPLSTIFQLHHGGQFLIKLKLLLSSDLFRYPVDILRLFNYKGLKIIWLSNRSILSVSDECFVKKRTE